MKPSDDLHEYLVLSQVVVAEFGKFVSVSEVAQHFIDVAVIYRVLFRLMVAAVFGCERVEVTYAISR